MKKYILSAATLLVLASCNVPDGGNKNVVKMAADQPRYSDQVDASQTEPNFAPSQADAPKATDSTKMAAAVKKVDSAAAKKVEAPKPTAEAKK